MKKSPVRWILIAAAVIVVASVASRPPASAPAGPLLPGAQVPPDVLAVLRRSCGDCHSDHTEYPWYSYVAPISFLINHDVEDGRRSLNFSRWNELPSVRRQRRLSEIANQVKDGEMPLPIYTYLHRDGVLTDAEKRAIFDWTQAERMRLILEGVDAPAAR